MDLVFEEDRIEGFGGWLVFNLAIIIGSFIATFYESFNWILIRFDELVQTFIFGVVGLGLIFGVLFFISVFKRSSLTPGLAVTFGIYTIVLNLIGTIFSNNHDLIVTIVTTVLAVAWMKYFNRSERVKNTFTAKYSKFSERFLKYLFISVFAMLAVIHIILVVLVTGVLSTILTLILPVLSEVYWFIMFWVESRFLNTYTSILILYLFGMALPFMTMLLYSPNQK